MRTISGVLLKVEAVLLAVPTLFGLIMGLKFLTAALMGELQPAEIPLGLMLLFMLALLVVGWYLLYRRLHYGPGALRSVSRLWWIAAGIGAAVSIGGFALLRTESKFAVLSMGMYGVPTFLHLALETWAWPVGPGLEKS